MFTLCQCDAREQLPPIKAQVWTKIEYVRKDGSIQNKSDFVTREMPYAEWEQLFRTYWAKFVVHHDVRKWQDDETVFLKVNVSDEAPHSKFKTSAKITALSANESIRASTFAR